jgi:hypothetical protein
MHTPAPQQESTGDSPAPAETAAAAAAHWAYLDHNTLTRRWRSVCRTCTYRGPWRTVPATAVEDGLAHTRTAPKGPTR